MSFFDRAKQVAGQTAAKAREELDEMQKRFELDRAYGELGKATFELVDTGELTQPELTATVERIRSLRTQLESKSGS